MQIPSSTQAKEARVDEDYYTNNNYTFMHLILIYFHLV